MAEMTGNGSKWLEIDKMAGIAVNVRKQLEMAEMTGNGSKWLTMT